MVFFHIINICKNLFLQAVSLICSCVYETIDIKSRGFAFQLDDHDSVDKLAR